MFLEFKKGPYLGDNLAWGTLPLGQHLRLSSLVFDGLGVASHRVVVVTLSVTETT